MLGHEGVAACLGMGGPGSISLSFAGTFGNQWVASHDRPCNDCWCSAGSGGETGTSGGGQAAEAGHGTGLGRSESLSLSSAGAQSPPGTAPCILLVWHGSLFQRGTISMPSMQASPGGGETIDYGISLMLTCDLL